MIGFGVAMPLQDAVDALGRRSPLGAALSSAELELLPVEIREVSFFSARVECERILAEMQRRILQAVRQERDAARSGTRTMSRTRFITEMQQVLREAGYEPDPELRGGLQDLSSFRRLSLIWDMQMEMAAGTALWKSEQTDVALRRAPAWELVRVASRIDVRDWPRIWLENGGKFYGAPGPDYPAAPGRMIALKTSDIWRRISRFGVPWPPFDWGSGMGLKSRRRREVLELRDTDGNPLLRPDDPPQKPLTTPFGKETKASLKGIAPERRAAIERDLAGDVEIRGDEIHLVSTERYDAMGRGDGKRRPRPPFDGIERAAPKPSDKALGETVVVERGMRHRSVRDALTDAIEVANRVHGDGVLPEVTVRVRGSLLNPAIAGGYRPTRAGSPPQLSINPNAVDARFTMLHELGHLLDNHGLHEATAERPYASWGQPAMREVMEAIRRTSGHARTAQRAAEEGRDYWLRPQELFARAYAQFIAYESEDAALVDTVLAIRRGEREDVGLWRESQWTAMDFGPVRKALAKLFTSLGWRYDR